MTGDALRAELIALQIKKLTRELYGSRSERTSLLLDQIELQFEELESAATEDEIAAEKAVAKITAVTAFTRKRPARKPFREHLPRERVIVPGPTTCLCCGRRGSNPRAAGAQRLCALALTRRSAFPP